MAENWIKPVTFNKKLRARTPSASPAGAATEKATPTLTPAKTGKITYQRTNCCTCPRAQRVLQLRLENLSLSKRPHVLQPKLRQLLLLQQQLNQKLVEIKSSRGKPRETKYRERPLNQKIIAEKLLHQHLPVHPAKSADS